MKLTLDTNCLINHFDTASKTATSTEEIAALIQLATSGHVELVVTTRAEADIEQDKDEKRRAEMLRVLGMFEVIGSVLRWDESKWDSGDLWADDGSSALADEIQKVLFPGLQEGSKHYGNKIRDVDHIVGHVIGRRDIFVTDDGRLNDRSSELKRFGAVIMRPADCLSYIQGVDERRKPRSLSSEEFSPEYHQRALSGEVTFDYSNNNGRFALGEGHFLFETAWSKASGHSIHAYQDPPSLEGLAIAQGAADIAAISDAEIYDFSSRTRTPQVGQVTIWRNVNGLYAATKILAIKDNTRGDDRDELSFEYRILMDGRSFA